MSHDQAVHRIAPIDSLVLSHDDDFDGTFTRCIKFMFIDGNQIDEKQPTADNDLMEIKRRSTRKWAEEVRYDAEKLFSKVRLLRGLFLLIRSKF